MPHSTVRSNTSWSSVSKPKTKLPQVAMPWSWSMSSVSLYCDGLFWPLAGELGGLFVDALEADEQRLAAALGHELDVLQALHRGQRALADPVLLQRDHPREELLGVRAMDHHVVVREHDELAERLAARASTSSAGRKRMDVPLAVETLQNSHG